MGFTDVDPVFDKQIKTQLGKRKLDRPAFTSLVKQLEAKNDSIRAALSFYARSGFDLTPSSVEKRDWQTCVLNVGSKNGITAEAAVIAETGLVGKTIIVAPESTTVSLITSRKCGVAVHVEGTRGMAFVWGTFPGGAIPPALELKFASKYTDLKPGANVYTDGQGGVYPGGIQVGKIKEFVMGPLSGQAILTPAADLAVLDYLFVVKREK